MGWKRNDKQGSEPKDDRTPVVPNPTTESERYCTTCNEWYNVKDANKHNH